MEGCCVHNSNLRQTWLTRNFYVTVCKSFIRRNSNSWFQWPQWPHWPKWPQSRRAEVMKGWFRIFTTFYRSLRTQLEGAICFLLQQQPVLTFYHRRRNEYAKIASQLRREYLCGHGLSMAPKKRKMDLHIVQTPVLITGSLIRGPFKPLKPNAD